MSQDTAGQEPVKKPETEVKNIQPNASEVDPEAVISQLLDENKKLAEDRDNYRKGLLKAKGKLVDGSIDEPEEDIDAKIERKLQEKLANTELATAQKRLADEAIRLARENKELKKSLGNRAQLGSTNGGSSQVDVPVAKNYFSPEKIAALKAKGWDDAKIERFRKNREKATTGGV